MTEKIGDSRFEKQQIDCFWYKLCPLWSFNSLGGEKKDIGFDSNDGVTRGVEASIDNSCQPQHERILLVWIIPASGHRALRISKFYQPTRE
ncbi:hypothetical protein [Nostoc sp. UHCC 0870]|uniref:hypothetical protein n=1 Tax=Nostoc sp. UHCC 0870 TaxID=2914041 RepID=UPI001EE03E3E|nr:hypothetical protein [Nostoc sp. UHCC 0870]UKP01573.1 hypothetical protein L6494_30570 [Nostoc sp. UHCC 0870]